MHKPYLIIFSILLIEFTACKKPVENHSNVLNDGTAIGVGAMRDVMWKGELGSKVAIDTLENSSALFGLGPLSGLRGEILINNGEVYIAKVNEDAEMQVTKTRNATAPFFVYAYNKDWKSFHLKDQPLSIKEIEQFIDEKVKKNERPFVFRLKGTIDSATIHVQNLAPDTKVSSPTEAHQGQVNYDLNDQEVEVIGFFSRQHQGIFTHHDSYIHMHLINSEGNYMGHLDAVSFGELELELPESLFWFLLIET